MQTLDYARIGSKIRNRRIAKNMTQEMLAEYAELSPVYISNVETGNKAVSLNALNSIAKALGVSVGEMLDENDTVPSVVIEAFEDCSPKGTVILSDAVVALSEILKEYLSGK